MTDLADRYGRHRRARPRWFWPVIATVGIAMGIAWAAWASFTDVPPYQAEVHSYDVRSDQSIRVDLDVYRDEPIALTCAVYAQAQDKTTVGEKSSRSPPRPTTTCGCGSRSAPNAAP